MVGRRKLPDPSLNHIFNALSIGVQYLLSFQLTNFALISFSIVSGPWQGVRVPVASFQIAPAGSAVSSNMRQGLKC